MAEVKVRERTAGHHLGRDRRNRCADCLGDERHGPAGAGIGLENIDLLALHRELDVNQAFDIEGPRERHRLLGEPSLHSGRQRKRWQCAS